MTKQLPNKILIYGSCVTRDPVESLLSDNSIELVKYLSKTAVVSQMAKKANFPHAIPDKTDFAARMIQHDIHKDVLSQIASSEFDYLIIDFVDERLPILKIGDSLYTGSRFFINEYGPHVSRENYCAPLISEAGRKTAVEALDQLLYKLKATNFPDNKLILHCAWWARIYRGDGNFFEFPKDQLLMCHEQNVSLRLLYEKVRSVFPKCIVLEADKGNIVTDAGHKWGNNPFHYIAEYNQQFNKMLMNVIHGKPIRANTAPAPQLKIKKPEIKKPEKPQNNNAKKNSPQLTFSQLENKKLLPDTSFYVGHVDRRDPLHKLHALESPYITHTKEHVAKFRDTGVEFDETGVPRNNFRWGGPYRYSVTIGHHGLSCFSRFAHNGEEEELKDAINVAKWLTENMARSGSWQVEFDHNWYPGRCDIIKAPWTSSMGQGLCISLLSRIVALFNAGKISSEYLDKRSAKLMLRSAEKALSPFTRNVADGGVATTLFGKYRCYEEYPTSPSSFVLNGFIYALLGLYDLWQLSKNSTARDLYRDGIHFLENCLCLYDLGRGSAYDLTHITTGIHPPNIARPSYHFIHVQLLSVLNTIENGKFASFVERWNAYFRGWGNRTN